MRKEISALSWSATWLLILSLAALGTGCASWWKDEEPPPVIIDGEPAVRFSENNNVLNVNDRNYRRMTRDRLEEEAQLHAQAGSTWVMDGQGAYLFAQNRARKEGDLLKVQIEGAAKKQVETKVSVIKELLKELEEEERKQKGEADEKTENPKLGGGPEGGKGDRAPAVAAEPPKDAKEENSIAESVPTRITERLADGNYRVKGQQPFMIGKREYKVLVTGIIRPEDFNDEGVSSNRLLDPQFDVVSIRKKETR